jgi:hypothetical protein
MAYSYIYEPFVPKCVNGIMNIPGSVTYLNTIVLTFV